MEETKEFSQLLQSKIESKLFKCGQEENVLKLDAWVLANEPKDANVVAAALDYPARVLLNILAPLCRMHV